MTLPLLSSCYKEDAQELYSRQYVTSVNLHMLNRTADSLNLVIVNLQNAIEVLKNRQPVQKIVYNVYNGDTLGATLTIDTLVAYIPFGRNGKDGMNGRDGKDGTQLSISTDGFWIIDGQKTDIRAQGRDGKDGSNGKDGVNGRDGKDGSRISISDDGFWVIDGQKTNVRAQGRDGKDGVNGANGQGPVISIGVNGNWVIDGQDTGHSALGKNGKDGRNGRDGKDGANGQAPQISLRENTDDLSDKNIYWYISYPDGTGHFLTLNGTKVRANGEKGEKGENGQKGETGDQGPQGTPGLNSPITNIAYGPGNKSIVITTTLPGLSSVTIPLQNLRFDIQPESCTAGGVASPTSFDVAKMQLAFRPGETLVFPFTKDDDLETVYATLSNNWKVVIDQAAKTIEITAPTVRQLASRDNEGTAVFYARTETGNTYSRNLNLLIPKKVEIGYFYRENPDFMTELPSTRSNELNLAAETGNFAHYFLLAKRDNAGNYQQFLEDRSSYSPADLTAKFKKDDFYSFDKDENLDNQELRTIDYFFKVDSVLRGATSGDPTQVSTHVLLPKQELDDAMSEEARYIVPIPWATFSAYRGYSTGDRYLQTTTRLLRLPMMVKLQMKNPKKHLGLEDSEVFDPSKVVLYHPTVYGLHAHGGALRSHVYGKNKAAQDVVKMYVARAENSASYDKNKDILYGSFATGPVHESIWMRLMIEYTKANGQVVRKVLAQGNMVSGTSHRLRSNGTLPLPGNGGQVIYSYEIPLPNNESSFPSYLGSIQSNGQARYMSSLLLSDVLDEDAF